MRSIITGLGACVLLAGIAIATFGHITKRADLSSDATKNRLVSQVGGIPLYPGAKQLSGGSGQGTWSGVYEFRVDASLDDIMAFYKETLPKSNWVLTRESAGTVPGATDTRGLGFIWRGNGPSVLIRRYLDIGLTLFSEGWVGLSMDYELWPDPAQIPLYPGAAQTKSDWVVDASQGISETVTTYLTKATPDEVLTYYRDKMVEQGWTPVDAQVQASELSFSYGRGGPEAMTWNDASIITEKQLEQQTKVSVRVSGTDLVPPHDPGRK